jgi:hypothetical protein
VIIKQFDMAIAHIQAATMTAGEVREMMETSDGEIEEEEEEEIPEVMPPDVPRLAEVGSDENVDPQLQPATWNEEEELDEDGLTQHRDVAGELTEVH